MEQIGQYAVTLYQNNKHMEEQRLWNRNYNKVMVTNFCLYFAFYITMPLLPLYLSEHFGATKDTIGAVLAGYTITALLVRPFSGYVVDSFNRKKVLLLCLAANCLFMGSYLIAGSLFLFTVFRTLHGGPFGACTVANSTVAIDVLHPSRRNEGIGFYGLSNNIATAIAPSIGIFIYQQTQCFEWLFWIALVISLTGLIADSLVEIPLKEIVKNKEKISLDRFFLTNGWLIGVNVVLVGFCYGVISNYLAIYGKEMLGITNGTGTFFLILSSGLIASRLIGNRTLKKGLIARNCGLGLMLSSIGYGTFVFVQNPIGYYGSALLIGLGNGHLWPAFQNMMIGVAHHNERGTANSTLLTSWDLGIGFGVLSGGFIAEHIGYHHAFLVMFLMHCLATLLFYTGTKNFFEKRKLAQ